MGKSLRPLPPPPASAGSEVPSAKEEEFRSVVEQVETKSKCDNTTTKIKQMLVVLEAILSKIGIVITEITSLKTTIDSYITAINVLIKSVKNAVTTIETAVDKAGKTVITVQLDPKYIQQLEAYKKEAVEMGKGYLDEMLYKERELTSEHYYALENLMNNKKGIWLSQNTFLTWMIATFIFIGLLLAILAIWIVSFFN